jgi:mRNA interferase MazF
VSLTTNLDLAALPGNVFVPAVAAGLEEDSVVNVTQMITVDRDFLEERIGTLDEALLKRVEDGLRLIQGL